MKTNSFLFFTILSICFFANFKSNAQRNVAMYKPADANTYYLSTNTNYNLPFYITDMGPTFSYVIKYSYSINNGPIIHEVGNGDHNKNWNCVNGPGFSKYRIALQTPLNFTTPGTYTLKLWIDSLDGHADANHSNDTLVKKLKAINNCPTRKGLMEYAYHVSCGPCGEDGTPFYEHTIANYSANVVCVKLHNFGATSPAAWAKLNCPEARAIDTAFGSTAHPDFTFNRSNLEPFDNGDEFYPKYCPADSAYFIRDLNYSNKVPAEFSFKNYSLNTTTNKLNFTLETTFKDALTFSKETRLCVMIAEDSIWDFMANNGAPIPDSIYHRFVLRKVYGNAFGEAGSIPTAVGVNQVVSFVVSDSVKAAWNKKHLYLIPVIMNYGSAQADHEVLQAQLFSCKELAYPLSVSNASTSKLAIYPNPASDKINIECQQKIAKYELYALDGKLCGKEELQSKNNKCIINTQQLLSGIYILKLADENGNAFTERIVIEK